MPQIAVNGETIHYERRGEGPTLALFHSLGTNSYLWDVQMAHWQGRFTCIAFDARGHGKSTNQGGVTMADVARDGHAALDALGLLPAHIMGISMGALQCAHFHHHAPDDVLSVVYADSFAYLGGMGPTRVEQMRDRVSSMTMSEYGAAYAADTLLPATAPEQTEKLKAAIAGMSAEDYLQTVEAVFLDDVRDALKAIDKPTHIIVGDQDQRTPVAASRAVKELVPHASLEVIPNAAHLSNIDNPDGYAAAVDPFYRRFD